MEWLFEKPIAHRGLHNSAEFIPENSLSAFEKAKIKKNPIELDVRISSDGKIIVFHDYSLKRMTGIQKFVCNVSSAQLKNAYLSGTDQKIPSLNEVLSLVKGEVPLLIEIKNEGRIENLEPALFKILKDYKGDFALQSFNPFSLMWFKNNAPGMLRGQLASSFSSLNAEIYKKIILRYMFFNWKSKPDFISYDITALPSWRVAAIRNKGIPVLSWTIKHDDDLLKAKKFSDNYIFENIRLEEPVNV